MSHLIGTILLGLVSGAAGWLVAQAFLSPRLRWSPFVSKRRQGDLPSGYIYRVKVKNGSFFRSAVDLRFQARVYFTHTYKNGSTLGRSIRLGTNPKDVPRMRPRGNELISIYVEDIDERTLDRLHALGYDHVRARTRTLEDLLALPKAFLSVQVVAIDSWSGAAHYLESIRYRLHDGPGIEYAAFVTGKHELDESVRLFNRLRLRLRQRVAKVSSRMHPELQRREPDPDDRDDPNQT